MSYRTLYELCPSTLLGLLLNLELPLPFPSLTPGVLLLHAWCWYAVLLTQLIAHLYETDIESKVLRNHAWNLSYTNAAFLDHRTVCIYTDLCECDCHDLRTWRNRWRHYRCFPPVDTEELKIQSKLMHVMQNHSQLLCQFKRSLQSLQFITTKLCITPSQDSSAFAEWH